jgi:hypothetical protein
MPSETRKLLPPNAFPNFYNNTPVPRNNTYKKSNKKTRVHFPNNLRNQSHLRLAPNSGATQSAANKEIAEARLSAKSNDLFIRKVMTARNPNGTMSKNGTRNISGLRRRITASEAKQYANELHQHLSNQYAINRGGRRKTKRSRK